MTDFVEEQFQMNGGRAVGWYLRARTALDERGRRNAAVGFYQFTVYDNTAKWIDSSYPEEFLLSVVRTAYARSGFECGPVVT